MLAILFGYNLSKPENFFTSVAILRKDGFTIIIKKKIVILFSLKGGSYLNGNGSCLIARIKIE